MKILVLSLRWLVLVTFPFHVNVCWVIFCHQVQCIVAVHTSVLTIATWGRPSHASPFPR